MALPNQVVGVVRVEEKAVTKGSDFVLISLSHMSAAVRFSEARTLHDDGLIYAVQEITNMFGDVASLYQSASFGDREGGKGGDGCSFCDEVIRFGISG